jgi:ketosteroid isomerase-like protein
MMLRSVLPFTGTWSTMNRTVMGSVAALGATGLLLLAGCAASRPVTSASTSASLDAVEAQVREALQRFNAAAAAGDLAAVMAQFDDRDDLLLAGSDKGEVFKGRAAMEGWLGRLLKQSRFSWQMDRVEVSHAGDTAWAFVDGSMTVTDAAGKVRGTTPYRIAAVLVKRGGVWRWRLFDGSVPGGH